MISPDSRYSDSSVVTLVTPSGKTVNVIVPSASQSYTFSYVYYIITGQDRVDTIASAFYNDPSQWWRFADANPEIVDWSQVTAGTLIRIPNA
jgi:hypothetical protein